MSIFIIEKSSFFEMFNHFIDVIIKTWIFDSIYGAFSPPPPYEILSQEREKKCLKKWKILK